MLKRHLCKVLCFTLIFCCFISAGFSSASAAEKPSVTISYDKIKQLITKLETELSSRTPEDRRLMYSAGKTYFYSNESIGNVLIPLIKNPDSMANVSPSLVELAKSFADYENELVFVLNFIKSIDTDTGNKKEDALNSFTAKTPYEDMSSKEATALSDIYTALVGDFREALYNDHKVTDKVLLNLFSCIKGSFVLTDDKNSTGKLSLSFINSSFSSRLSNNMSAYFSDINGKSTSSGESILTAIIDAVNSSETNSMIANYKSVFGALNMYTPYEKPSTGDSKSPRGSSGAIRYDNPLYQPVVIPAPQPAPSVLSSIERMEDVKTHWSSPYVSVLVNKRVLKGYEGGEFKPDQGITREEVAVALVRALGLEARLENIADASFTDGAEIGDWSKKAVALLVEMKILNGYEDGSFRPKNVISREELAAIIARSVTKSANNIVINFKDKNSIMSWAESSIQKAYALGIIRGYEDNTFRPGNSVTRAEVATMLYNFMVTENLL